MTDVAARLAAIGWALPQAPAPVGAYVPARRVGNLVFTAGQLPLRDGQLVAKGQVIASEDDGVADGWVRDSAAVDIATARECAALAAINTLAAAATVVPVDQLAGVVKLTGFVAAARDFESHALVLNGASELFATAFGSDGMHARSAVGVKSLPLGAPVEVEAIFEIAQR